MIIEMITDHIIGQAGSTTRYAAGERYLLDKQQARAFITLGVAIDPENPPAPEVAEEATEDATDEHSDSND